MTKKKSTEAEKNYTRVAENRRARFDFFIEDTLEVGIVLKGSEIKPLRAGRVSIVESYAEVKEGEIYLVNANIETHGNTNKKWQHDPKRPRKLLLHKKEANRLIGSVERKGITLVPLGLYFNHKGIAKLTLGIAKGKKQHDKRETEKTRDWNRQKSRIMRGEKC